MNSLKPVLTDAYMNCLDDGNDKWGHFYNCIESESDKTCPIRKFCFKKDKPSWLTHYLIELIKDKDYLLKKARENKLDVDKANARRARNLVNSSMESEVGLCERTV